MSREPQREYTMSTALGLLLPLVAAVAAVAALAVPAANARFSPTAHGSRVRLGGGGGLAASWGPVAAHGAAGAACNEVAFLEETGGADGYWLKLGQVRAASCAGRC